ncbi:WD40 repeat-like protein [Coprinopsis marcescibilis]|uniref:WD40 repeat-like protein n=1 Tax=Coprinopsis marcescibilis TaxID=230819 RepID=A0A5C3KDP9_COPMA|nr:WD40 repeat-like protein [Coprinopsis marcescibilis]
MSSDYADPQSTVTLPSLPFDSISAIRWSPVSPDQMLVASWDTTVRLYDIGDVPCNTGGKPSEMRAKFDHRAAVLACAWGEGPSAGKAYSGGLDTGVRELDLEKEQIAHLGTHDDSISAMVWAKETNNLITGSWDRTIRFWDPRSTTSQISQHSTPERIYAMDLVNNTLVVAMASRLFHIYDIRNLTKPLQERESSLKYMTRSLACMLDGQGYATASVEGRIAVEYFDPAPEIQEKKYAFKCHRQTTKDAVPQHDGTTQTEEVDHVWPVNGLAFCPRFNTFASAGSDGTVSIWDFKVKKRLRQYPKYPNPVSAIGFSCDGTRLAVAASYTWDEGEHGLKTAKAPWLGVRKLGDEVRPKGWTA